MSAGRVAIVTGGGSGIGRAVALALAGRGYRIALAGRREGALRETAALFPHGSPDPLCVACDVTDERAVVDLFARTSERFGRVDLLFNNAGVGAPAMPIEDLTLDAWNAVVATNVTGAFLCMREAFRVMKRQSPRGGRIINNGSVSAQSPRPHSAPYTASKHAITGLTKSGSLDGRAHDIACGQIDIGNAATAMGERMAQGVPQANGTVAAEPIMAVEHVGAAVCYMDSLPLSANVPFMTLMATAMPLVGRG